MKITSSFLTAFILVGALFSSTGCGSDSNGRRSPTPTNAIPPTVASTATPRPPTTTPLPPASPTPTPDGLLDISICEPDRGPFSATIDHPFFPLVVGAKWILEGEDDEGAEVRLEIASLDETQTVAGVSTRVVEEREWVDGELSEVSRNYFVRTTNGAVCYYGEHVDFYEDGEIVSHDGTWLVGEDGALPGILLPPNPTVGQRFQQEAAPGIALDEAEIVAAGESVQVPLGSFGDTIRLAEFNPLDGGTSEKIYARGVGLIRDDEFDRVPE